MGNYSTGWAAIVLAAASSVTAVATERGQSEYLYTEFSEPGETEVKFIVRIAPISAILAVVLGLGFCGGLAAQDKVLSHYLYTEQSESGETLDAFAYRISRRANDTSRKLKSEVCGIFLPAASGGYEITIRTNNAQKNCYVIGWKEGLQDFHTHPPGTSSNISAHDYETPGYMSSHRGAVWHQRGRGTLRSVKPSKPGDVNNYTAAYQISVA